MIVPLSERTSDMSCCREQDVPGLELFVQRGEEGEEESPIMLLAYRCVCARSTG